MEVINDAREALTMDRTLEFEEWFPAWMVDDNGQLTNDEPRMKSLRMIFDGIKKELGIN
jgi:hypothetical protein